MTIKTYYTRDSQGSCKALTTIPLAADRRELDISTFKGGRGGLVTSATVHQKSEDGRSSTHAIGFGSCGDYSKRLADDRGARCTEKNVRAQHDRCIVEAAAILADAEAWYAEGRNIRK